MEPSVEREFQKRIGLLQAGDQFAVEEFVAQYEPYIRRTLRIRLKQSLLGAAADSVDVCQSVMGGFLLRLFAGEFVLQSEEDLQKLLIGIAKKKFLSLQRRELAEKRSRKLTRSLSDLPEQNCKTSDPVVLAQIQDLEQALRERLTVEEQELLQRRREGQDWNEIQTDLQIDTVLLRKRLSRALRRVSDELGLDY